MLFLKRIIKNVALNWFIIMTGVSAYKSETVNVGFIYGSNSVSIKRAAEMAVKIANISEHATKISINQITSTIDVRDSYNLSTAICEQLREMVFAVICMSDTNSYEIIQGYSKSLQVPFIVSSAHRNRKKDATGYELIMNPSYIPAIVAYVRHFKWKRIFYLYDGDDGLWRLQQMYDIMNTSKPEFEIIIRRLPVSGLSYDVLHELDRMGNVCAEKIFVLDLGNVESTKLLLRQVVDVGMNREGYHFIIGGLDTTAYNFSIFRHGGVNITGFSILLKTKSLNDVIHKWNITEKKEPFKIAPPFTVESALIMDGIAFLTTALHALYMNETTKRMIFATRRHQHFNGNDTRDGIRCDSRPLVPFYNGPILLEQLHKTQIPGLSGHVAFDRYGYRKNYKFDIYKMGFKKPFQKIGIWSSESGLDIESHDHAKHSNKSSTIIITTVMEPPFLQEKKSNNDSGIKVVEYEGYVWDLMELFNKSGYIDFDYEIRPRPDKEYGTELANGTWTGMIGELVDGKADIAIAPITITEERERAVDFTKPFMKTGISLMIKRPEKRKPGIFSFKEPLSNAVWLCITIGFLAVSVMLFLIGRFSPYEWTENCREGPSEDFNFLNSLWSSLGALMQQGSDIFPRSLSGRCAESAWWFFTMILISSYTANLAAFLTIEQMDYPVSSVDDLADQTDIKYGCFSGGSTKDYFENSKVYTYEKMWSFMNSSNSGLMNSNIDGWKEVQRRKAKYAFLLESTFNDYLNQRKPCTTMKVGGLINSIDYGIATRSGSDLTKRLNLAVLELRERGELIKLKNKWWFDKGMCGASGGDQSKKRSSLSLSNVSGMFHILIGGLVISMVTAVLEYIIHSRITKRKYTLKKAKLQKASEQNNTTHSTMANNDHHSKKKVKLSGELQPLRPHDNGAQENKGYQTSSPGNLITFDGLDNSQTGTMI